eukprot:48199-Lingulodinium_polyedra.AAC.1
MLGYASVVQAGTLQRSGHRHQSARFRSLFAAKTVRWRTCEYGHLLLNVTLVFASVIRAVATTRPVGSVFLYGGA